MSLPYKISFQPDYIEINEKMSKITEKANGSTSSRPTEQFEELLMNIQTQIQDEELQFHPEPLYSEYANINKLQEEKKRMGQLCPGCGEQLKKIIQCQFCALCYCKGCCFRKRVIPGLSGPKQFKLCCEECHLKFVKLLQNQRFYAQSELLLKVIQFAKTKYQKSEAKVIEQRQKADIAKKFRMETKIKENAVAKEIKNQEKLLQQAQQKFKQLIAEKAQKMRQQRQEKQKEKQKKLQEQRKQKQKKQKQELQRQEKQKEAERERKRQQDLLQENNKKKEAENAKLIEQNKKKEKNEKEKIEREKIEAKKKEELQKKENAKKLEEEARLAEEKKKQELKNKEIEKKKIEEAAKIQKIQIQEKVNPPILTAVVADNSKEKQEENALSTKKSTDIHKQGEETTNKSDNEQSLNSDIKESKQKQEEEEEFEEQENPLQNIDVATMSVNDLLKIRVNPNEAASPRKSRTSKQVLAPLTEQIEAEFKLTSKEQPQIARQILDGGNEEDLQNNEILEAKKKIFRSSSINNSYQNINNEQEEEETAPSPGNKCSCQIM